MLAEATSTVYSDSHETRTGALCRNIFVRPSIRIASQADEEHEEDVSPYLSVGKTSLRHSAERLAILTSIEDRPAAEGSAEAYYRLIREHIDVEPATGAVFTHTDIHPFVSEAAWPEIDRESLIRTIRDLLKDWSTRPSLGVAWLASPHDPSADPLRQYFTDAAESELKREAAQQQIEARLTDLKAEAADEGIQISETSERALRRFLRHYRPKQRPAIALLENGNLRIQWRRLNGEQVSLQFRGDDEIQFVFFVRRRDILASYAGRDSFDGVGARLKADELLDLVTG